MDGVKSTAENLTAAIQGENYESVTMYPEMIKDAEAENDKRALSSFKKAMAVEKEHEQLYRDALANLDQKSESYDYYVMPDLRFYPSSQCSRCLPGMWCSKRQLHKNRIVL